MVKGGIIVTMESLSPSLSLSPPLFHNLLPVCEELSLPGSGSIEYSSNQSIGSTASYINFQCTMGFEQSGDLVRRCSESGWDGEIPHCSKYYKQQYKI